ncbi:YbfB/YjiJ family MFS transporter [Undibacterium terreum]|uniref:MFS transporter n=1 Tax=Undibacterium terreum TaxID=1224302 RepID=A0A916UGJ1_9BURK|nr:YbfB/YjiJ family MFS transporter [Undibacterium terreum]GGC72611.1 MFS transporter [Undibacterium terreum]
MTETRASLAMRRPFLTALALSLGTAIALGLTRFSYALLLSPMRSDLGWNYTLAGSMNTGNALGYFFGALATPLLIRRLGIPAVFLSGALGAGAFMLLSGASLETIPLLLLRILSGLASALSFIAGGVLAARLASMHSHRAGLLIGLYYGGTGIGITLSALLIPPAMQLATEHGYAHSWQWAWYLLGSLCLLGAMLMAPPARQIPQPPAQATQHAKFHISAFAYGLSAYFMFGVGYIGYMTFVVALLKEQGMQATSITIFYALLGLAVLCSSRIWAGMLDRYKGGQSMAILNALLSVATILPVLTSAPVFIFISGLLFGGVFLSTVASTTALVRHNLPHAAWSSGIGAFTVTFAVGQVLGPVLVGWVADGAGGLTHGLQLSALALLISALLAWRQPAWITRRMRP